MLTYSSLKGWLESADLYWIWYICIIWDQFFSSSRNKVCILSCCHYMCRARGWTWWSLWDQSTLGRDPCGTLPTQDILWFFCPPLSEASTSVWYLRKLWNLFSKYSQIPLCTVISSQATNICFGLSLISTATKLPPSAVPWFGVTSKKKWRWTTQVFKENMGNPGWAEAEMTRRVFICSLCAPAVNPWSLKNNLSIMSPLLKMSAVNSLRSFIIS